MKARSGYFERLISFGVPRKEGRSSQVPGLVLDKDAMRQMDFAVEKL